MCHFGQARKQPPSRTPMQKVPGSGARLDSRVDR